MLAVLLADEGAAPLSMILVGIACVAVSAAGFRWLVNHEARSDDNYAWRTEILLAGIGLFGVASFTSGVAKV